MTDSRRQFFAAVKKSEFQGLLNALCIVLHELHGIGLHLFALRAVKYVALCRVALRCVVLRFERRAS